MTWKSEKHYPGGKVVYEPIGYCDRYWIIYRHPIEGDFVRGAISHFELMQKEGEFELMQKEGE